MNPKSVAHRGLAAPGRVRAEDLSGDNSGTFAFDGLEAAAQRAKDAAEDQASGCWVQPMK